MKIQCEENVRKKWGNFLTFSTLFPHIFHTFSSQKIPHISAGNWPDSSHGKCEEKCKENVRKVNVRKIVRKMGSSKMWGKMWGNFNFFPYNFPTLFPHMDAGNWPLSSHGNVRKMWGKLWAKFHYYFSAWIPHIETGKNPHICEEKCGEKCEENFPFSTYFFTISTHWCFIIINCKENGHFSYNEMWENGLTPAHKYIMTREVVVSTEFFTWMQVNEMKRREEIR